MTIFRCLVGLVLISVWCAGLAAQEYKSAREAQAAAAPHLRSRNYAAAQAPLEAALKLTPESETRERIRIYRTLMASYRLLPDPAKMMEAAEYIQEHSPQAAERSVIASDFVSFMHQRGKTEEAIARYEARLKAEPKDIVALGVLSTIYLRLQQDKTRGEALKSALAKVNRERAAAEAERMEQTASARADAAASEWKNVAQMWVEAGNLEKAKAAVDESLKSTPESRSGILTMQWREGLGDVLMEVGDREEAVRQYQQALDHAPAEILKKGIQTKLDKARLQKT